MWVDKGVPETHGALLPIFPYSGPRWYFRPLVEFMIDRRFISWKHVFWGLTATTHLPADVFKAPFDEIARLCWDEKQAKLAFNSMLGYWGIYDNVFYKAFTTCNPEDVAQYGEPFKVCHVVDRYVLLEGEQLPRQRDYVYATKQLTTRSLRPIHQITLDVEHLRLAQAICLARQFCELRQVCTLVWTLFTSSRPSARPMRPRRRSKTSPTRSSTKST